MTYQYYLVLIGSALALCCLIAKTDASVTISAPTPGATINITEDVVMGSAVVTVSATDGTSSTLTYALVQSPSTSTPKFSVNSQNGGITTSGSFDYEQLNDRTYVITVTASNKVPESASVSFTVSIINVNDNSPVFSPNVYYQSIAENTLPGTSVVQLTVNDADGDSITVTILSGDDATSKFTVATKLIQTSSTVIDYETLSNSNFKYALTIIASDGSRTGTATVFVTITSVNEFSPVLGSFNTNQSMREDSGIGTTIVTLSASDLDLGIDGVILFQLGAVTPSTGSPFMSWFHLDQVSGVLTTIRNTFDCDTATGGVPYYDIVVYAEDQGVNPGKKSANSTVRLWLLDVNDNTPTFDQNLYTITISETTAVFVPILTLTATDKDLTFTLTYSIATSSTPSSYSTHFQLNGTQLILKAPVDLDTSTPDPAYYNINIKVSDGGSPTLSSTTEVVVKVTYANEFSPVFQSPVVIGSVNEDVNVGQSVITLTATDADNGNDGMLTYSITAGNGDGKFSVNPVNGLISTAAAIDFESKPQYVLAIKATDGGGNSVTTALTINVVDVSDEIPTCTSYSFSTSFLEEGTINSLIARLSCSDKDAIDTLTYSIISGNSLLKFQVGTNGSVTLASTIDYDTELKFYQFVVEVTDGKYKLNIPVDVQVLPNNEASPIFAPIPNITVEESSAVGLTIFSQAATDTDAPPDGIVKYAIWSVSNSGASKFSIDESTGIIKLAQPLDYETQTIYVITVLAIDGGAKTGTGHVTVLISNVNDVTPTCSPDSIVTSLNENTAKNTTVISSFGCSDIDGPYLSYSITTQTPASIFVLDTTGALPTLKVDSSPNYEASTASVLEIRVSDGTFYTTVAVHIAIVDVNEGPITFSSTIYMTSVNEDASVGALVTTVTANDPDLKTSPNGNLFYSILNGNADNKFIINPSSGRILVAGVLNAKTKSIYSLVIQAIEEVGINSATTTVNITINNVRNQAPSCTPSLAFTVLMAEEGITGDILYRFTCSDPDGDTLTYTLSSGSVTYFQINSTVPGSEYLKLIAQIDYDTVVSNQFGVVIDVSDGKSTLQLQGSIVVTGVNEHSPLFSQTIYNKNEPENTSPGTLITTLTANDGDKGDTVTFSWVSSPTSFTLDQLSGNILLSGSLDRETTPSYSMLVRASDGTNSMTATVAILVTDINDNSPIFNQNSYSATVSESAPAVTTVTTVNATDKDDPATYNYGTVTYSITDGNTESQFAVHSTSGVITTTAQLDYEKTAFYTLYVRAMDSNGGLGAKSSTAVVTVNVGPINEYDPVFGSSIYSINIAENTVVGTSILSVHATDADHGNDGTVYYSVVSHTYFYLDPLTGYVYVKASLDYESIRNFTFVVTAFDSGISQRSASVSVTVSITDINDNTPSCFPNLQTKLFPENLTPGSVLASLNCSDADGTSPNSALSYYIVGVNDITTVTPFAMASSNILLDVSSNFNYENVKAYDIKIRVFDGGSPSLTTTATVKMDISDINEYTPQFTGTTYSFTISENSPLGYTIFVLSATDLDTSQTVSYSIVNKTGSAFDITQDTGAVIAIAPLDYETMGTVKYYVIAFLAVDNGNNPNALTSTATATITIANANDATPIFSPAMYVVSVSENIGSTTAVTTVTATDIDSTFVYSLLNSYSIFTVNSGGTITVSNLDYETTKSYVLVADAADIDGHSGSATVHVQVNGYNEFSPVFSNTTAFKSLNENSALGTTIIQVNATDNDAGPDGAITYSILSEPSGLEGSLAIDPNNGVVTVAATLDMELITNSLLFVIKAADAGTSPGVKSATFSLTLIILDVNDNMPVCSESLYSSAISEAAVQGTTVATISCSDKDATSPNKNLNYTIVTGNDANFWLNSSTGVVTVYPATPTLDRETIASYKLVIRVVDGGSPVLSTTTTLTVSLTDVNDNAPIFSPASYTFTIDENKNVGFVVGTVTASDADTGLAGSFVYSIFSGNTDSNMDVDGNSGEIKILGVVNYEQTRFYTVVIYAIDKMAPFKTGSTTVIINIGDLNDVRPSCVPALQNIAVPENQLTGTTFATINCTDPEAGLFGTVNYVISSVDGSATTSPFLIDPVKGTVQLNANLDYESYKLKSIVIYAIDGGSLTGSATLNVAITDINEFAPQFTSTPYTGTVSESANIGATVFVVSATDADTANIITYSLSPVSNVFDIDPLTGKLYLQTKLDFETTSSYALTVFATDNGVPTKSSFTSLNISVINVNDGIPVFNPAVYTVSISENANVGTTVATVIATDSDGPLPITYTFFSGNNAGVFRIEPSGVIAIDSTTNLDFDSATKSYTLVVKASDGTNTGTATVAVAVTNYNDYVPYFTNTSSTQMVPENTATGYLIVTVSASDNDAGTDGVITYSITSGNTANLFAVNPSTGAVSVAGILDKEAIDTVTVYINATDGGTNPGPLSAQYILTVLVTDVNDVTPVCTSSLYTANVDENSAISTTVMQLTCSDADKMPPNNNIIAYTIVSGNAGAYFSVSTTGFISVAGLIDRETVSNVTIVVKAIDGGNPALTTTTTVKVTINDLNDNSPAFLTNPYHVTTSESTPVGTSIVRVSATDLDSGAAGTVFYNIISGNTDSRFVIDRSTGEVKIVSFLDFETASANPYVLSVQAVDGDATAPKTGTTTISLTITDFNDNTPSCTPALQEVQKPESTAGSSTITSLVCVDLDASPNNALSYSIVSVNGNTFSTLFAVDASGVITTNTNTSFDYETTTSYAILVRVKDGGAISLSFTATVYVSITDVNEYPPNFQSTPYSTNVPETATVGSTIYMVIAQDQDTANNVTFSIYPPNSYFQIDPSSGIIKLTASIDYDTLSVPTILIVVEAKDNGVPAKTSTTTVTVSVINVNDGIPVFKPGVYVLSIPENSTVGTTVTTVSVIDIDDQTFMFSFFGGNTGNVFQINTNGAIVVDSTANLDYDSPIKSYVLVARAVDYGNHTATATVIIQVTNINEFTPVVSMTSNIVTVPENSAIGTNVATVNATDKDDGTDGIITYSIYTVTNSGDVMFVIDSNSGLVSVSGLLDCETASQYKITILATDGGKIPGALTATYTLTVYVQDLNDVVPSCSKAVYSATVSEGAAVPSYVAQLVCWDNDSTANNNVISNYTIKSGNTYSTFGILSTGEVRVALALDREALDNYKLVIDVVDGGLPGLTFTATLTITVTDVNDNTPTFTTNPYNFNKSENTAVGTTIGTVVATDADIGDSGRIIYSIFSGDVNSKFTIDRTSGDIILSHDLDFETATANPYILIIRATDSDVIKLTGSTSVIITVNDINDNAPVCIPQLSTLAFPESTTTPTRLTTLNCTDKDSLANAALTYTIISVNNASVSSPFAIDTSGAIRLTLLMDFESITVYTIFVKINDNGTPSLSSTSTINVEVTDVNDNVPAFSGLPYLVNITENMVVGSTIFRVTAGDLDVKNTVTFSLNPAMANFDIDPAKGDIILTTAVDYDFATRLFEVIVVAKDDGSPSLSSSATVSVTIKNTNDGTPVFNPGVYAVTLSENAAVGFTVLTVTVTDIDSTVFTYAIISGNTDNIFGISDSTAVSKLTVVNNAKLDYETTTSYNIVVSVSDGSLSSSASIYVQITGYNEFIPVITATSSAPTIPENSVLGLSVANVTATDQDKGSDGIVTLQIISGAFGKFAIDPSGGLVTVSGTLDRETVSSYTVVIYAVDSGKLPGSFTATYTLTVTISDVNDFSPVCSSSLYSASISESSAIGTTVAQLYCTDADATSPNNVIALYTIVSGITGGEFLLSTSGTITSSVLLDRETRDSYQLQIIVSDNGTFPSARSTTTTLTVAITDANDNQPSFRLPIYNINVAEDTAVYASIGNISATDADIGLAGSVWYNIAGGNTAGKFVLDKSTGVVKVVSKLDYETMASYTLTVEAIDKEPTFKTGTATVSVTITDVNDNAPVCTRSLYTGTISENAALLTPVATVQCTDADLTIGNIVTYSITSGQTEFNIDPNSGQISTKEFLDIETTASYTLIVEASDGSLTSSATVTVALLDINDNNPMFSPLGPYIKTINESLVIGTIIFDLNATDADVTPTNFVFSITSGNDAANFFISASAGIIQVQKVIDRDKPLITSYTLGISVADGTIAGSRSASTSIVVTISDVNDNFPNCDATTYTVTFAESTNVGSTIISPACTDLDVVASPALLYNITGGNTELKFQINTGTGVLTLQNALDYETTISYTLTVLVNDQGSPNLVTSLTMIIYVDPINEFIPIFQGTPYDVAISENKLQGYQILRISATDADTGSTQGTVRYSITSGNAAGRFSINPSTGWIVVAGPLDRESVSSYALTVAASDMTSSDAGARTTQNTFVITILDENDNYPVINPAAYSTTIYENALSGASITKVQATDDDFGLAGTAGLQYFITNGNTGNPFSMNSSTGWITLTGTVDAYKTSVYVLTVTVQDQGSPILSSYAIVSIEINATNDYAPSFTTSSFNITVPESQAVGSSIYHTAASDLDTGIYSVLRFYIRGGNIGNVFSIESFSGDVRIAHKLDYDSPPTTYQLIIEVEDTISSTSFTKTSSMTLTINLSDVNDETPIFSQTLYSASLKENVALGTTVTSVTATDKDSGVNGALTYSILSGTGATTFSINPVSGAIFTLLSVDFEDYSLYDLVVTVNDNGIVKLTSTCIVRITILDLNDNLPMFEAGNVSVSVSEETAISTTVCTVVATDMDSLANNNNLITYSMPTANFKIDPRSGIITTTSRLDRETNASYTVKIFAEDGGIPQNTGTITYTIVLTDVNDNSPSVNGQIYDVVVPEDSPINKVVFYINATDKDEHENSFLAYNITAGNTNTDFRIDIGSGLIQVRKPLDRETTNKYLLEVTIADHGTPSLSATVTATVTLGDVNDNPPVFQPAPISVYNFSVSENVPLGTFVDRVNATDADTGVNAALTYFIAYFIIGNNTHFVVDPATGVISTAGPIDRETQDRYAFVLRAMDGGINTLTATVSVSINIIDVNDNIPYFNKQLYTANIVENLPVGSSILTVAETDLDITVNRDVTLTISTSTSAGIRANMYIGANSSTSILYVKQQIDRETDLIFNFILIATDHGIPPLSYTTSVIITIGDENDNRPIFSKTFYNSEIAYNDNCQVIATTITATDADIGVNAAIKYSVTQNNNPQLFVLDASSGDVKLIATATSNTGYKIYAAATDGGSPALDSSTGATIRVDTYNPSEVILNYYMSISKSSYLSMETTFLSELTTVYGQTYPTSQAKRWCVQGVTETSCIVRVYVIRDNTADEPSELNNNKKFLSMDEAYAITAADDFGTPAAVITGIGWTSFVITRVEKYFIKQEASSTPWLKTTAGIVTLSVLIPLLCIVAVIITVVAIYRSRAKKHVGSCVHISDADEGDHVANKQYLHMTHTTDDLYGDKTHPPPAIVSLPMPRATKKAPKYAGDIPLGKPSIDTNNFNFNLKDVHLISNDDIITGHNLLKKPCKLRSENPFSTESTNFPSLLSTSRRPPAARPSRHGEDTTSPKAADGTLDDTDAISDNYVVLDREFDGRSIEPASGRLYEYNTRTNDRRWVNTPGGQQVKLKLEEN